MIALIQRVTQAEVRVGERLTGAIGRGLLALIGVQRDDTEADAARLLVSQFTLAADTRSGTRPGFGTAAEPQRARVLFDYLLAQSRSAHPHIATGEFGADMQVSLVNDGPVTFWLETRGAGAGSP